MSLWHKIKKELDGPFETVRKGLADALDMAEDLTRKGRTKLEIQSAKSDIHSQMADLGGRVHQMLVEENLVDVAGDVEVQAILDRIKKLEQKIAEKEEDLRRENAVRAEKQAS